MIANTKGGGEQANERTQEPAGVDRVREDAQVPAPIQDERENLPSASSMDMLNRCPGSFQAQQGLPDLPEQQVTADGTRIHDALHSGDDSDLGMTEKEIAQKIAEMERAETERWLEDLGLTLSQTIRETRLWVRNPLTLEIIASAKPDLIQLGAPGHALIIDAKTGFAETTPSERNWQLRCQTIAVFREYSQVEHVRAAIAHSRLSSTFDATDYDLNDLKRIERELLHILWRAQQPDAPRVPGPWCRYCRANGLCREKTVYDQLAASQLPVQAGPPDKLSIIQAVDRLTPPEMAFLFRRKSSMEFAYEALEARMKALPSDVLESVGYKIAPGNNNKEITDVPTAFARLKTILTEDERMATLRITRGQAAELLADRASISKKSAQELIDQAIGDAMRDKPGNPKLKQI